MCSTRSSKGNLMKRIFGDLVPSMSKNMSVIFSITCQDVKINILGFNLTQRTSSVISNTGVRNKIVPLLDKFTSGSKIALMGTYISPIPIRG